MSLIARELESAGIPTVVLGSAYDIVTHARVPRFYFTDLPLGNPCGQPGTRNEQARILRAAVSMFATAKAPEAIEHSNAAWPHDAWRDAFLAVTDDNIEALRAAGEARRAERAALRATDRTR